MHSKKKGILELEDKEVRRSKRLVRMVENLLSITRIGDGNSKDP